LSFYRSVVDQAKSSPGVSGAALVNTLPLGGRVSKRSLDIEGFTAPGSNNLPLFWLDVVTPDYFRVMGISLLSGRRFTKADESGNPPVAVVTASSAQKFWPGKNAIGQHIRFAREDEWRTVVGVIVDVRAYDLQNNVPDYINGTLYVPYNSKATQEVGGVPAEMTIAIRTTLDEAQTGAMLRRVVNGLSQEVPVSEVKTMNAVVSEAVSTPASTTSLFVTFAALALVLAIVGIYGVLSFLVAKRTHEIGIRIALGAQRSDVLWLVMKEGAKFSFAGIGLGLAGAFFLSRLLSSQLFGITAMDPITYVGVAGVMTIVTLLACYIPTRRAMKIDPLIALRFE
jgi:putative ABC transport system permease protein